MLYPVFDFSVYHLKTPIQNIKHFFFDLKCCRDRIRKGCCEKDAWDLDVWFLTVMPGVLDLLREHTDSIPSCIEKECSEGREIARPPEEGKGVSGQFPDAYDQDAERIAFTRWKDILGEMSRLFREARPGYLHYRPSPQDIECRKKAMALLDKYFEHLWN